MIPQRFIEEVQARTDIVELISSFIPLKKTGRNFKALCPFHSEKTPSFIISPQKQIFHCFGCGEGGGALHFLMRYEKINFVEAIECLAKRCGLEVPFQKTTPQEKTKTLLYDVVSDASKFFFENLSLRPEGSAAREYLIKRGVTADLIKQFKIGCALSQFPLIEYMRKRGVSLDLLERAALIVSRKEGGYSDLFRERIIFPIFDVRNRIIGFGARLIKDKENAPKYINSLENALYSKREHLYGLNFAKEEILNKRFVIVVEGYLDMITPYAKGMKNIVASLGTALTAEQIRLLKRYTTNVVLVYDADTAGQLANLRAVDLLLEQGIRIGIVKLPRGYDPDSLVREKGGDFFSNLLEKKMDCFDYKAEVLQRTCDIESIEGKTTFAQEMLSTLDKISSEVEKYEYIKRLAFYLSVREEVLLLELRKLRKPNKQSFISPAASAKASVPITERRILQFMIHNKKAMVLIKKNINENDFCHPLAKKAAGVLFRNFVEDEPWVIPAILSRVEEREISCFFSELLMEEGVSLNRDLLKGCILKVRGRRLKDIKDSLKRQLKEAEAQRDDKKIKELIVKYKEVSSGRKKYA